MIYLRKNMIKARQYYRLTQEAAASRIGIKRCTLGAYEEDRAIPPPSTLIQICAAYKIHSIHNFVFGEYFIMAKDQLKRRRQKFDYQKV